MAIKSGLFNSVNKDRVYRAEDFADYFATFISNGVFPNPSTGLQVIANGNMNVVIRAGKAWIFGYYMTNDADYSLKVDVADGVLNRIDRVVLRLDYASRSIYPTIKKGAFATVPVAPALQRNADAYEIALADIAVNKGVLSITQANITDLRLNKDLCGIVHGTVDQVDTTTIFNQYQSWYQQYTSNKATEFDNWQSDQESDFLIWSNERRTEFESWSSTQQADFLAWFESIKDILDGDVAANLTNRITQLEQEFDRHKADDVRHITADERTKWNGAQLFKLTQDDGVANNAPTDLNNAKTSGSFVVSTTTTTNKPAAYGLLKVSQRSRGTQATVLQEFFDTVSSVIYIRQLDVNAVWSPWKKIAKIDDIEQDSYKTTKLNKDTNGIFTTIEQRRKPDNTLVRKSVLSGGTSPNYTTRTITYYDTNGTTVIKTDTFTLTYDSDGDLIGEA